MARPYSLVNPIAQYLSCAVVEPQFAQTAVPQSNIMMNIKAIVQRNIIAAHILEVISKASFLRTTNIRR
jgi:hypothetical protein